MSARRSGQEDAHEEDPAAESSWLATSASSAPRSRTRSSTRANQALAERNTGPAKLRARPSGRGRAGPLADARHLRRARSRRSRAPAAPASTSTTTRRRSQLKLDMARQCWDESPPRRDLGEARRPHGHRDRRVHRGDVPLRGRVHRRPDPAPLRRQPRARGPRHRRVQHDEGVRRRRPATRCSSSARTGCSPTR